MNNEQLAAERHALALIRSSMSGDQAEMFTAANAVERWELVAMRAAAMAALLGKLLDEATGHPVGHSVNAFEGWDLELMWRQSESGDGRT